MASNGGSQVSRVESDRTSMSGVSKTIEAISALDAKVPRYLAQKRSVRAGLCARWQINCAPYADGLIRLSCSYKRLSRSNFILRFWLSHPTASRRTTLPALIRSRSFSLVQPPTHPRCRFYLPLSLTLSRTLPLSPCSPFAPMSRAP